MLLVIPQRSIRSVGVLFLFELISISFWIWDVVWGGVGALGVDLGCGLLLLGGRRIGILNIGYGHWESAILTSSSVGES
jgi:hypothetical protein